MIAPTNAPTFRIPNSFPTIPFSPLLTALTLNTAFPYNESEMKPT